MKINFGQANQEDVDNFGDEGLFGPDTNGNFYYYDLEFGTNPGGLEDYIIRDGCGRGIPLSVDHINELIAALESIRDFSEAVKYADKLTEFAASDTQGYVENNEVVFDDEPVSDFVGHSRY